MFGPGKGLFQRARDDMARKMRDMIRPLGNLEQRPAPDTADNRVIPARKRFGADYAVVFQRILGLEEDLDLVAVDRGKQIGFELAV